MMAKVWIVSKGVRYEASQIRAVCAHPADAAIAAEALLSPGRWVPDGENRWRQTDGIDVVWVEEHDVQASLRDDSWPGVWEQD